MLCFTDISPYHHHYHTTHPNVFSFIENTSYNFYILHEIFFHPKIHNSADKVRCIKKKLSYKSKLVPVCINHAEPKMFHRLYTFSLYTFHGFSAKRHNKRVARALLFQSLIYFQLKFYSVKFNSTIFNFLKELRKT